MMTIHVLWYPSWRSACATPPSCGSEVAQAASTRTAGPGQACSTLEAADLVVLREQAVDGVEDQEDEPVPLTDGDVGICGGLSHAPGDGVHAGVR
jgi:hypothetical protein